MHTREYDDWTIERWRIEPRVHALDMELDDTAEQNPPLWKDLTLASIVAILLWGVAAVVFA